MKRRAIFTALLFSRILRAESPCPSTEPTQFPCLFNAWAARSASAKAGTVDAKEIELWLQVKECWKKVERFIDAKYGL